MNHSGTSTTARQTAAPGQGPISDPSSRALADAFWRTRFNKQFLSVIPELFSERDQPLAQHVCDCLEGGYSIQRPSSLTSGHSLRLAMVYGQSLRWHAKYEQYLADRTQPWLAPGGPLPFPKDYTPPPLPDGELKEVTKIDLSKDEEPEEATKANPSTNEEVCTRLSGAVEPIEEPGNTLPGSRGQATSPSAETIGAEVEAAPDASSQLPAREGRRRWKSCPDIFHPGA
ncbi:hypothetical protein ACJ41O_004735 [Fusarium nematophilum]